MACEHLQNLPAWSQNLKKVRDVDVEQWVNDKVDVMFKV